MKNSHLAMAALVAAVTQMPGLSSGTAWAQDTQSLESGRTVAFGPANSPKRTSIASGERASLRVAQADVASTTARVDGQASAVALEEIVVTATRRAEGLTDVPMSIAAIGAAEISRRNLVTQTDFLRTVPGVNQIESGAGASSIVMRGIAINPTGEGFNLGLTTATFLGEVPLSSGRVGQPDLRLIDIERVEVLRGPQGTQFGSSAIAGTLRYIPAPPELSKVSGYVKAGYSVTRGEGGSNDKIEGVLNLPLIDDVLGLRAVAYRYFDHGYVRNVGASNPTFVSQAAALGISELAGQGRVGNTTAEGGRLAALWRPSDAFSLTVTLLKQKLTQDGKLEVQEFASPATETSGIYYPAVSGSYDQVRWTFDNTFGRGELQVDDTEIANALLEYDVGWGQLLGSVSYSEQAFQNLNDIGLFFGDAQGGNPLVQDFTQGSKSTAVETRFTSKFDGPFGLVAGLYYEDSEMLRGGANKFGGTLDQMQLYYPGAPDRSLGDFLVGDNTEQKAGYAELSYEIVEGLEAIVGARAFRYDVERPSTLDGILFGGSSHTSLSATDSGEVYRGTLSYQARENAMVYATFSQGFRLGFPQAPVPVICDGDGDGFIDGLDGVSTQLSAVHPDNLDNIEVGAKLRWSDRVEINAAAFDIKWEGLPVTVVGTCGFNVVLNAGEASSRGVELETKVLVVPRLVVSLQASYTKAELAKDAPGVGLEGERLPGAPEYNARVAVDYDFDVAGYKAYVQGDVGYVGGFYTAVGTTGPEIGDYTQVGLRGGVQVGAFDVSLFANNLTNARAPVWIDPLSGVANILRPATYGMYVGYRF